MPSIQTTTSPKEQSRDSADDLNSSLSSSSGSSLFQSLCTVSASEESRLHPHVATPPKSCGAHPVCVQPISTCSPPEHPVTLCIKLPNCDRIEHKFDYKRDRIKDVIHFVHCFMTGEETIPPKLKLGDVCLSDNNIPINTYCDHSLTLYEAGLIHNTLLHFSYK